MSVYRVITMNGSDPGLEPYRHLIFSSFLKSLRYLNPWFALIDQTAYFDMYHAVIENLLKRPMAVVKLAVLDDEPGEDETHTCLGWSLSEDNRLHYVFVKVDLRKQGIGKQLLPKDFNEISHLTVIGKHIWQRKFPKVAFNPFL